jgi:pyruvate,water dikinase
MQEKKRLVWFNEVGRHDIGLVGGKGANLGEMVKAGFPVPPGFIVTATAYYYFLKENNLQEHIKRILKTTDLNDPHQLTQASLKIRHLFRQGKVPHDLAQEIILAYDKLSGFFKHALVAVRSSATAEDLPDASFAGQQETFLNVQGEANVVNKIRDSWSSLFTPRAIFYREQKKFNHFKIGIAIPVQKMLQSEVSGVMFTIDPVNNDKGKIVIEAIWGLGELIVQGAVTPDHYEVAKSSFKVVAKQLNKQVIQLVKVDRLNKEVKVKNGDQKKQKLTNEQIITLARIGKKIQQHYFFPQDIEWALEKGKLYILQTRPVTTIDMNAKRKNEKTNKISLPLVLKGDPASPGVASGYARVIHSAKEIGKVKRGEVLITEMTTPDFVPAMKKVVAIITNKGGRVSHAAIVSRELGVPCVVGTEKATKIIKTGHLVTVNGSTGEIYEGAVEKTPLTIASLTSPITNNQSPITNLHTATKVYVNLGEPDLAKTVAQQNVDGVGLLRAEFMISEMIGVHPKKLIHDKKEKEFIDKLAEGLKTFCEAFTPRPVVYRTTDFKTNEYRNLIGGKAYEPEEANPMLGFRGAYRYIKDESVFELEIEAIKKVRHKYGFKNLWLMLPFVRKVKELEEVKKIIASCGLMRSPSFKLWMMVEIPSNVILLEDFIAAGIDGVSIGTNDLTMLLLGIDRDNDQVALEFDERNKAVLWALEKIITTAQKHKITSSVCGQAPSEYPDLTEKLVHWGITSVSVSPDMIDKTRNIVYRAEKKRVLGYSPKS